MCITIQDIARRHKEWVSVAIYTGARAHEAEDVVQSLYLKLCEKAEAEGGLCSITYQGKVNTAYVFTSIRNLVIDLRRGTDPQEFQDGIHDTTDNTPEVDEEAFHQLTEGIYNTIDQLHWYDRELFKHYIKSGKSIRQIAQQTGISRTSINNTIQNVKSEIRKQHGAEVQQVHGKTDNKAKRAATKFRSRR